MWFGFKTLIIEASIWKSYPGSLDWFLKSVGPTNPLIRYFLKNIILRGGQFGFLSLSSRTQLSNEHLEGFLRPLRRGISRPIDIRVGFFLQNQWLSSKNGKKHINHGIKFW